MLRRSPLRTMWWAPKSVRWRPATCVGNADGLGTSGAARAVHLPRQHRDLLLNAMRNEHFINPSPLASIRAPDALSCRSLLWEPRTSLRGGLSYGSRSPAKPPPPPERASSTSTGRWSYGPAPPMSVCCPPRGRCPGLGGLPPGSLDPYITASFVWNKPLWLPQSTERGAAKWL